MCYEGSKALYGSTLRYQGTLSFYRTIHIGSRRLPVPEPEVVINQHGAGRLLSGHLWVYRSDIRSSTGEGGEVVRVLDERGRFFGRAFFSDRSEICVRVVTREDVPVDHAYLAERIARAARLRQPMIEKSGAYRLFYAESDQIPSLVIDRYENYIVIQTPSHGRPNGANRSSSTSLSNSSSPQRHPRTQRSQRYANSKDSTSGSPCSTARCPPR